MTTEEHGRHVRIDFAGQRTKQIELGFLQSAIFPVVVKSGDKIRSVGTCFAISNHGLCLTARHVIEDIPLSEDFDELGNRLFASEVGILYMDPDYAGDDLKEGDIFGGFTPIRTAHLIDLTDIALIHVNFPTNIKTGEFPRIHVSKLCVQPPKTGEQVIGFGYDKGIWIETDSGHDLDHNFTATGGKVIEVFEVRRDSVMLPFPCFQTSSTFLSGMSGGPVIGENGMVIGVITSSFNLGGEEQPLSYASLLSPALHLQLLAGTEDGSSEPAFLWDFAAGGAVHVDFGDVIVEREHDLLRTKSGNFLAISKLNNSVNDGKN